MQFRILSHAGLWVEHDGVSLLIDPWLFGSAYWRSWWNFPPVDEASCASLAPDFIYLTHIHWDHFHGPTLRRLAANSTILIPYVRSPRMRTDLARMGLRNVREIMHGRRVTLAAGFYLTPYVFSPHDDSVAMVEASGITLMNANDCKIIGAPLAQVLRNHPVIDFAFRSHSSANSRVLYETLPIGGQPPLDDRAAYIASFGNFMRAIRPRHAIPFASNHCHLHRETQRFNAWIVSPLDVHDALCAHDAGSVPVQVMLPGSGWCARDGFTLAPLTLFLDRNAAIDALAAENALRLEAAYEKERLATLPDAVVRNYFSRVYSHVNLLFRRRFRNHPIVLRAYSGERDAAVTESFWSIDLYARGVSAATRNDWDNATARLDAPALVLRHALQLNMFGHVSISKRVRFQATTEALPTLRLFELLLCLEEAELIPFSGLLQLRTLRVYARRWRELLLYAQVGWLRFVRRIPFQQIEQRLLAARSK